MGGRGSASNLQNRKADIIAFPTKNSTKKTGSWNYPGMSERTEQLKDAVEKANTRAKVSSAYRGLKGHESNLIANINNPKEDGDKKVLMTELRKTRQLLRKITGKGKTYKYHSQTGDRMDCDDCWRECVDECR